MGATVERVADVGRADVETALQGARAGDPVAFEGVVSTRLAGAFRLASAMLGSEGEAVEATRNAFVAAWRELPRLADLDAFDAWLHRILLNECLMQVRRALGEGSTSIAPPATTAPLETGHGGGPPQTSAWTADDAWDLDRATALDRLERAFEGLDAADRAILVLHHLENTPLADVAASLHMPAGTVRWRHHEARDALYRALDAAR